MIVSHNQYFSELLSTITWSVLSIKQRLLLNVIKSQLKIRHLSIQIEDFAHYFGKKHREIVYLRPKFTKVKRLNSIHFIAVLVVTIVGSAAVALRLLFHIQPAANPTFSYLADIIAIIASIGSILGASALTKEAIGDLKYKTEVADKMNIYRIAFAKKMMLIGVGGVLCSVAYFATGKNSALFLLCMLIIYMLVSRPAKYKVAETINTEEENIPT